MRAAPPIGVKLRRFEAWKAAVVLLGALGDIVLIAWASIRPEPIRGIEVAAVAALLIASTGLLVALLRHAAPTELRWDGRAWHLGPASGATTGGDIEVAIDLGAWLLLRFSAGEGPLGHRRGRVRWLPVQRRGLEPQWHALRCALYAPRPAAGAESDPA